MSTTVDTASSSSTSGRTGLVPRLGSALAFVPLAVWTTWHLWDNTYAFRGAQPWQEHVAPDRSPIVELITLVIVFAPLVLHAVWGIRRLFILRANLGRYPTFDNVKFLLQRLTAIGLLAFIPAHVYLARIEPAIRTQGGHESFALIAAAMAHHVPTLVVYVLGVLATTYHLANGIATGGLTWGYASSPKAVRRLNAWSYGIFVVLLALGWGSLYALYTAGQDLPYQGDEAGSQSPDPAAMRNADVPPVTRP